MHPVMTLPAQQDRVTTTMSMRVPDTAAPPVMDMPAALKTTLTLPIIPVKNRGPILCCQIVTHRPSAIITMLTWSIQCFCCSVSRSSQSV